MDRGLWCPYKLYQTVYDVLVDCTGCKPIMTVASVQVNKIIISEDGISIVDENGVEHSKIYKTYEEAESIANDLGESLKAGGISIDF